MKTKSKPVLFRDGHTASALPENGYRTSSIYAKSAAFRIYARILKFSAAVAAKVISKI